MMSWSGVMRGMSLSGVVWSLRVVSVCVLEWNAVIFFEWCV